MHQYSVIGLMSGTSLDGLDIAHCTFQYDKDKWSYGLHYAETIKYDAAWYIKLKDAHLLNGEELVKLHHEYGVFLGNKIKKFSKKYQLKDLDFVSSHGHTIFHNPKQGVTFQLGNGTSIAATCGIKVICDFRVLDVALKGQGAPLVPVGDKLLFPEYDFCLNLGGYSNISFEHNRRRIAFDICPVNTALNYLASAIGKSFDKDGRMAQSGKINIQLLSKLNRLKYYSKEHPKSLGREWLSAHFLPLLNASSIAVEDKLATMVEHIAHQLSAGILKHSKRGTVLITGGGAHNRFLISTLREKLPSYEIVIPSENLVNYKEALVFAFLGVLKIEQKVNTLRSVTGAIRNSSGGILCIP